MGVEFVPKGLKTQHSWAGQAPKLLLADAALGRRVLMGEGPTTVSIVVLVFLSTSLFGDAEETHRARNPMANAVASVSPCFARAKRAWLGCWNRVRFHCTSLNCCVHAPPNKVILKLSARGTYMFVRPHFPFGPQPRRKPRQLPRSTSSCSLSLFQPTMTLTSHLGSGAPVCFQPWEVCQQIHVASLLVGRTTAQLCWSLACHCHASSEVQDRDRRLSEAIHECLCFYRNRCRGHTRNGQVPLLRDAP